MTPALLLITTAAAIAIASLLGVLVLWQLFGRSVHVNLSLLVTFSAGVFSVVAVLLVRESLHTFASSAYQLSYAGISFVAGALFMILVFRILPMFHHHHGELDDHTHGPLDARAILIGDGIHNLADGLLLAAGLAISTALGLTTALAIFVHELVQEAAEFFVLKAAGYSTWQALLLNLAVSSAILVGAVVGFFALGSAMWIDGPLLAGAAGAFAVIVLRDLLPRTVLATRNVRKIAPYALSFLVGVGLMLAVTLIMPHSHSRGHAAYLDIIPAQVESHGGVVHPARQFTATNLPL